MHINRPLSCSQPCSARFRGLIPGPLGSHLERGKAPSSPLGPLDLPQVPPWRKKGEDGQCTGNCVLGRHPYIWMCACVCACMHVYMYVSIYLPTDLPTCLPIYLSIIPNRRPYTNVKDVRQFLCCDPFS